MNFVVKERDRIFVRVSTNQKIWQSLILAKLIGQNSYRLVIGKFAYNQATVDLRVELDPGEYIICIHHEWLLQDSGNYAVFLSSRSHIRLSKRELNKYPNFLVKLFAEYESRADKSLIGKSLYSLRLMVEETGFAYLYINPRNSKSKMISVLVDKK